MRRAKCTGRWAKWEVLNWSGIGRGGRSSCALTLFCGPANSNYVQVIKKDINDPGHASAGRNGARVEDSSLSEEATQQFPPPHHDDIGGLPGWLIHTLAAPIAIVFATALAASTLPGWGASLPVAILLEDMMAIVVVGSTVVGSTVVGFTVVVMRAVAVLLRQQSTTLPPWPLLPLPLPHRPHGATASA